MKEELASIGRVCYAVHRSNFLYYCFHVFVDLTEEMRDDGKGFIQDFKSWVHCQTDSVHIALGTHEFIWERDIEASVDVLGAMTLALPSNAKISKKDVHNSNIRDFARGIDNMSERETSHLLSKADYMLLFQSKI